MKKKEVIQFKVREDNFSDWYTVVSLGKGKYEVTREGSGDYEKYETTQEEVERLKKLAIEII